METLEHEHTSEAIANRIAASNHNYIRDFIYGGIDGAVNHVCGGVGRLGC